VLIRADGSFLYTFTSVVDDVDFAITHIIRGEDHVTNAGVQLALFEALGAVAPLYAHHSLLVDRDGGPLSKRLGALSIASLREDGLEPMAVASHSALLGTSENIAAHHSLEALAALFGLDKVSRAPARFDPAELLAVNAQLLHALPFEAVAARLAAAGITGGGAAFWEAVRGNLERFSDVSQWWQVVAGPIEPVIENASLCAHAVQLLPEEPWDAATWPAWTKAVAAATGTKGRQLFHPLRLALTGRETGPELKALLPLIGRARALARLQGRTG
jgi:glutamyl-tRNA synthetase